MSEYNILTIIIILLIVASISVSAFALLVVLAIVITAIIGFLYCKRKHTNSDSGGCPRGDGDPRGDVPLESFSNQQESQGILLDVIYCHVI